MNLLYFWSEQPEGNEGFNFSSKYYFKYDEKTSALEHKPNPNYVEGFYGKNIFDAICIVGENGSGKTTLLNRLMNAMSIPAIKGEPVEIRDGNTFFIVFEVDGTPSIYNKTHKDINNYPIVEDELFISYKTVYLHNTLSLNDYEFEKYPHNVDLSLGNKLRQQYRQQIQNEEVSIDIIKEYYHDKMEHILEFLHACNKEELQILGIPTPNKIILEVKGITKNYLNVEQSIEADSRKFDPDAFSPPKTTLIDDFKAFIRDIRCLFSGTHSFKIKLCEAILLNAIRWFALPLSTRPHFGEWQMIIDNRKILFAEGELENNIIENINLFLCSLHKQRNSSSHSVEKYIDFIKWINSTDITQDFYYSNESDYVHLLKFFALYKKTTLISSYLNFNFGLSTGEFNFITLFSDIYSLVENSRGKKGIFNQTNTAPVQCSNVLIIIDEADMHSHPKWQRNYVSRLTKFIETLPHSNFHIILATHSPIMLSDFTDDRVVYLPKSNNEMKTFGQNIHTLFLNAFFLNDCGTMGEFAENKIKKMVAEIRNGQADENANKILEAIGDTQIRTRLIEMLDLSLRVPPALVNNRTNKNLAESIQLLKAQKVQLEMLIEKMECLQDD